VITPDRITALFTICAAFMWLLTLAKAYRLKEVKGVSVWTPLYFLVWTTWNTFYFWYLAQYWTATIGIVMLVIEGAWVVFVIRYTKPEIALEQIENL
jgi:hypothetical protein